MRNPCGNSYFWGKTVVWSCPCTTVHLEHPLSLPTPSRKDPKQLVRRGMLTCGLDQKDGFDFYMFNCMRNPCGNSYFWGKTVVWSCPCKTLHLEHPLSLPTPSRKDPKQLVRRGMLTCGLDQKDGFDFYMFNCMRNPCGNSCFWGKTVVWSCPCKTLHLEHPPKLPTPSRKDPKQLVRIGMLTCGLDQKDGFDFYMFNCMRNPCGNSFFWGENRGMVLPLQNVTLRTSIFAT